MKEELEKEILDLQTKYQLCISGEDWTQAFDLESEIEEKQQILIRLKNGERQ